MLRRLTIRMIIVAACASLAIFATHLTTRALPQVPFAHPYYIEAQPYVSTPTYSLGFSPQQIRGAYNISSTFRGAGITIAIVDAYDDPTAAADFDTFSRQFGLPTIAGGCKCFTKVDQVGGTNYPAVNTGWAGEIALDIEWAHAIAPQAKILLIESIDSTFANMFTAESYAIANATVISNSWGAAEFGGEVAFDATLNAAGVAILFSAGDNGCLLYTSPSPRD